MPSARPREAVLSILKMWQDRGYRVAIQRDDTEPHSDLTRGEWSQVELVNYGPYGGYANAVNWLSHYVLEIDKEAQWIVCAGDDTEPDLVHSADEIARECERHFAGTFGVLQCTGDRWGDHRNTHQFTPRTAGAPSGQMCSQCGRVKDNSIHMVGAYVDRVAGSPWMGREFCLRINQGRGPLWPEYFHMGCDEELQSVATLLGVFWQRPDLNQLHKHWGREAGKSNMPDFLKRANSAEEWQAYKKLFAEREAAGFPGSEPL